ncbi:extracellular solute-binding protein [Streptomyces aidingensis]|uniref:Multiple sugar transport system substrate-binding protein n=1 Tax=Streptomyces aidingensis TaxID=910347 RepID=A0A1I1QC97_9ACTN|nr:extracellular solute-binding protein [Streptomyces aidingensis]SFD16853.1 multiple sugar transport system substrate-binding protein [Streptomyces aidingensis]
MATQNPTTTGPAPARAPASLAARMRRTAAGATAGAVALLAPAGCAAFQDTADTTVITVLAADFGAGPATGAARERWNSLAAGYRAEHPGVTVEVELVPRAELDGLLARRVAEGSPPDIAQTGSYVPYAADGLLHPVREILPPAVQADFLLALSRAGEYRLEQYAMPYLASTPRLLWNPELFRAAGLEGPPADWAELARAARALGDAGVEVPYALQLAEGSATQEILVWMLAGGGGLTGGAGEYRLDSAANIATLTWLRDHLVAPGLAKDPYPADRDAVTEAFLGGRIGMLLAHPPLVRAAETAGLPYDHAAFPAREGGPALPLGLTDWLIAFRDGGRGEAAGEFLGYLYAADRVTAATARDGTLPTTVSAAERLRGMPQGQPLRPFFEQMAESVLQPVDKRSWPEVAALLEDAIGRALEPGGDPAAVLSRLQNEARRAEETAPS